jgi:DNA-binding MarR family transcriptional regulator
MEHMDSTIVAVFEKLGQLERSLMWEVAKREKLSPIQMQIIVYIRNTRAELCTVSSLALEFNLTKPTVSDAVKSLTEKGLVRKNPGKMDRRSYTLELTAAGRKSVARIAQWPEVLLRHLNRFPEAEKSAAMRFLMDLLKSLLGDGVLNVARMCVVCDNFEENARPGADRPHRCRLTQTFVSDGELNMGCRYFTRPSGKKK